jgi:hypothetical protein
VAPIFLCRKNPLPIWQQLHCVCTTTSISGRKRAEIKAMLIWERHVQARVVLCYCSCLFFFPLFIFSNNNQTSKNSNFLYHINNFFITIQIKKFNTNSFYFISHHHFILISKLTIHFSVLYKHLPNISKNSLMQNPLAKGAPKLQACSFILWHLFVCFYKLYTS